MDLQVLLESFEQLKSRASCLESLLPNYDLFVGDSKLVAREFDVAG